MRTVSVRPLTARLRARLGMSLITQSGGCNPLRGLVCRRTAGLAGCLFAASLLAQDQTAQITGTVLDAATHQPVKHASVTLNSASPQSARSNHSVSADAAGAFSFDGLAEGTYLLNATQMNYPNLPNRARVELKSGGKATVTLELTPGAVLSGHVMDEDGDPMQGCFVQTMLARHSGSAGANSNQDGEYRIHGLAPGKYLVSVRCGTAAFVPRPFSTGPDPPPSLAYPMQFYPAVSDAKSAQPMELAAGVEKPGVDFRMRPMPITQVRGTVSSSTGDLAPERGVQIQLVPLDRPDETIGTGLNGPRSFEFATVFPGSYYLVAMINGDPTKRMSAVEKIEVKDRPIEVALTLSPGVDMAGTVTVDDSNAPTKISVATVQVQLIPELRAGGVDVAQVKEDGSFVLKSVPAGRWKVAVILGPVFLKSAWLGNTEVTHTAFDVSSGAESLRIVVSGNMATIEGTAPAGEMVFLENEDAWQGFRGAQTDQIGRFTMGGLAPGKYRVVAGDPGGTIPTEGGQEITVKEGETATVEIKQN